MAGSQLGQLKAALQTYSTNTSKQAQGLQGTLQNYQAAAQQILGLIGGSSQGKDREVEQAVVEARQKVEQASQALIRAATIAKNYASTL